MRFEAIFATHPTVVTIDETTGAFDKNGQQITLDESIVQAKIAELKAAEPLRLLREERDRRLTATDWRATIDYPGDDQAAWLEYRQALRDITLQDPENVTWPEEPA